MSNEKLLEEIKENLESLYSGYPPNKDYDKLVEMIEELVETNRSCAMRDIE